jgi:hypothetical protein
VSAALDRGRLVCDRVARRIAQEAPAGLGHDPKVWELVARPSDAFLDALRAWEDADNTATRAALNHAVDELVSAWRRAADAYGHAARRPLLPKAGR